MAGDVTTAEQIRRRNRTTLDRYLGRDPSGGPVVFDGSAGTLEYTSEDHCAQAPFSPPGQFKVMRRADMGPMFEWIERTFPTPFLYTAVITHETEDPKVFWIEDDGLGMTTWRGGFVYANRHVWKLEFDDDGKVCNESEYFGTMAKYRIDLTELPEWDYNAERVRVGLDPVILPPKGRTHTYPLLVPPAPQAAPSEEGKKRIAALVDRIRADHRFVEGAYDHAGTWVADAEMVGALAADFCYELPWSPDGMLKIYDADERLAFSQFMARSLRDHRLVKQYFWATTDPTVFIFEDEREAEVTWRGGGLYHNRHVGVVRFTSDGLLKSWCEYFNPMQLFTMDGTAWPEWDMNVERARVGLEPVSLSWEETHVMPPLA